MLKITRRTFLKASAAIGAVAASGPILNTLKPSKAFAAESEFQMRPTACLGCTTWCAVEAKVQTVGNIARVVDIVGNRKSRSNGGYVCPRGRLSIQQMYDPDRVKTPMRRTNPNKGRGVNPGFIPISWDEAVDEIARKLIEMRYTPEPDEELKKHSGTVGAGSTTTTIVTDDESSAADAYKGYLVTVNNEIRMITASTAGSAGNPVVLTVEPALSAAPNQNDPFVVKASQSHKLAVLRGRYSTVNDVSNAILYSALPAIYGTPNKVSHSSICAESEKGAWVNVIGAWEYQDYDLDNCQCLLLWGSDPTSSNRMVPNAIRKLGKRIKAGMKLIVVDPRLSPAAAKAHIWAPIKPGTDGALAMAIAKFIWENMRDNTTLRGSGWDFITNRVDGDIGDNGVGGWISAAGLSVPEAASITGLAQSTIRKIACMFAGWSYDSDGNPIALIRTGHDQCKAISWVGPGIAMQPHGLYGAMAAAALNALVGSFDHLGGVINKKGSWTQVNGDVRAVQTSHKDALSSYKGAYMLGTNKRQYTRIDPNNMEKDYIGSTDPEVPLGLPGIGGGSNAVGGVNPTNMLGDALRLGYPYGRGNKANNCKMIISHFANFPFSCTGTKRWEDALSTPNAPFVVNIVTHVNELGMFSDIILPSDHHMFENYLFTHGQRADLANIMAMMRPVVGRLYPDDDYGTKWGETEFVWLLGRKMAEIAVGDVVPGWPTDYYFTKLKDYCDSYSPDAWNNTITTSWAFNKAVNAYRGAKNDPAVWAKLDSDNPSNYTEVATSIGVYGYGFGIHQSTVDKTPGGLYFNADGAGQYWVGTSAFGTVSGKVELYEAKKLKQQIEAHAAAHQYEGQPEKLIKACNYPQDGLYYMPHYVAPSLQGTGKRFVDYKSRLNREGRSANCPMYYEFKSCDAMDVKWRDVVKINPTDAAALNVVTGDWVKISGTYKVGNLPNIPSNEGGGPTYEFSDDIICRVVVTPTVKVGTVIKCYGQGHWAYGRMAKGRVTNFTNGVSYQGGNNNEILPGDYERIVGGNQRNGCMQVSITKISAPYTFVSPKQQFTG